MICEATRGAWLHASTRSPDDGVTFQPQSGEAISQVLLLRRLSRQNFSKQSIINHEKSMKAAGAFGNKKYVFKK